MWTASEMYYPSHVALGGQFMDIQFINLDKVS